MLFIILSLYPKYRKQKEEQPLMYHKDLEECCLDCFYTVPSSAEDPKDLFLNRMKCPGSTRYMYYPV